jgi:PA14 domain
MPALPQIALLLLAVPLLAGALAGCGAAPQPVVVVVSPSGPPVSPLDPPLPGQEDEAPPPGFGRVARIAAGLQGRIYALPQGTAYLPDFEKMEPLGAVYTTALDVTPRRFDQGFPGVTDRFEWFGIDYEGAFTVAVGGEYRFRLTADDGAKLFIDGNVVLQEDGIHPPTRIEGSVHLRPGPHRIHVPYFQGPRDELALVLEVAPPGEAYRVFRTDRPLGARAAVAAP